MKFKRLMSASLAGIMAVSSAVVCQIGASAAETVIDRELNTGEIGETTLEHNQWASDANAIANPAVELENVWSNPGSVKGYASVEITYTCGNTADVENIYLVAQGGTMPNDGWYQQTVKPEASGKVTLDLSEVQDKTYQIFVVQVQPKSTFAIGDTFNPQFKITSATLKAAEATTPAKTDAEIIAEAKTAAEGAVAELKKPGKVTEVTTSGDILFEIKTAVNNPDVETKWKGTPFDNPPTTTEAGKVGGTVSLSKGTESEEVEALFELAKLPANDAEAVAEAKKLIEEMLKTYGVSNETTKDEILKAAQEAVKGVAGVTVEVTCELTKATEKAEGSAVVTVTITCGTETDTVKKTFTIEKLPEAPKEETIEKKDPTAIWTGSTALGNWGTWIDLEGDKLADLGSGTIVIEVAEYVKGGQVCVKVQEGDWPTIDGTEVVDIAEGQTKVEIPVTADALAALKGKKVAVQGKLLTVTKVSFAKVEDACAKKVTVSANSSTEPSVSAVITNVDKTTGEREQVAVCAITEAQAKQYSSYTITLTRSSDGYIFTTEITECSKKSTYTNVNKEKVLVEAAEGDYCMVLDIKGIASDWGSLTIKITPNEAAAE